MEALASPCYSDMVRSLRTRVKFARQKKKECLLNSFLSCAITEQGVDQDFFNQWQLTALDLEAALGQDFQRSPSSESYTSSHPPKEEIRTKKISKTSSWSSCTTEHNSAPRILSFGNPDSPVCHSDLYGSLAATVKEKEQMDASNPNGSKRNYEHAHGQGNKRVNLGTRTAAHNQEHIMAERKRREKLSQRFIELSAIVPGLKKMDKASVLGDAIKHLKQLQDQVTSLEDQVAKRNVESAVLVKKSQLVDDDTSSSDENANERLQSGETLPEIEARVCEKTILIKIHCENRKGVLVKALSEIEKLHLSVINTSVMPFTSSSLDITVMSQIEEEFSMTPKDVVKELNSAFRQFMC
ncbi:transcription factor bHLH18-like [Canna indica]|uniref:Transcription factor bHLH18-like n=1 Tax=Canna indica TaxID=4628 RepID=A0AAQ3KLR8_9LILI|nr:transcription factor bHLH18-like [Canna indica]